MRAFQIGRPLQGRAFGGIKGCGDCDHLNDASGAFLSRIQIEVARSLPNHVNWESEVEFLPEPIRCVDWRAKNNGECQTGSVS
jgi:hypothetical protein